MLNDIQQFFCYAKLSGTLTTDVIYIADQIFLSNRKYLKTIGEYEGVEIYIVKDQMLGSGLAFMCSIL